MELPAGLDWEAFSALVFPGRERHDLEAVHAYVTYVDARSRPANSSEAPSPSFAPTAAPSRANVAVSPESLLPSAEASAETDAENEGMPPRPESTSDRALLGQGMGR